MPCLLLFQYKLIPCSLILLNQRKSKCIFEVFVIELFFDRWCLEESQAISTSVKLWASSLRRQDYSCSVPRPNSALTTESWSHGVFTDLQWIWLDDFVPLNVHFSFLPSRNGVERLREGKGILPPNVDVCYQPKWVNAEHKILFKRSRDPAEFLVNLYVQLINICIAPH